MHSLIHNVVLGTLFAISTVSGNFLGDLLPEKVQRKLTEDRRCKYMVLVLIIFGMLSCHNKEVATVTPILTVLFTVFLLANTTTWTCFLFIFCILVISRHLLYSFRNSDNIN